MFEDEAGFGRINNPKKCWAPKGVRPVVPCHHIREYRYAFGAVEPLTGENYFLIMPRCDTKCTNVFLQEISKTYPEDTILMVCDGAAWHKSKGLCIPENITLLNIPPYTPEMNPIEQIWKQLRSMGFRNEVFNTLDDVMERLCHTIQDLTNELVHSITCRSWISDCFLELE
jgi:putative transposase